MPLERLRLILLGLGGIALVAGGFWMAVTPGPIGNRLIGAFAVVFFSFGIWAMARMAFQGQKLPRQTARAWRHQKLVLPFVLVFTLPWGLKLWFALPLLAAWLALVPQYRDRRALVAAAIFASLLAVAQAVLFSFGAYAAIAEARGAGPIALNVVFLAMVLWLDGSLLWHVRGRLREQAPAGAAPTPFA